MVMKNKQGNHPEKGTTNPMKDTSTEPPCSIEREK